MLTWVPSHAQPGLYALQFTPGAGKHEPFAEHPAPLGKPQSMPVPHCASLVQEPGLVMLPLLSLPPELAPLEPAPPELEPPLVVDPLDPSAPPSSLPEVEVDPPQHARAAARTERPMHQTFPITEIVASDRFPGHKPQPQRRLLVRPTVRPTAGRRVCSMCTKTGYRAAVACWPCFWKTDPDQWILPAHWNALHPVVPFERLPLLDPYSIIATPGAWDAARYPWPL
jgi:hypothetical protein